MHAPAALFAAALAASLAAAGLPHAIPLVPGAAAGGVPRPGVVLFWASWCVPCATELKRVPALRAAARPLPLVLLALDSPEAAREALGRMGMAADDGFADARPPARVLAEWGAPALPLAVAIDARGRICARKQGLLGTDELRDWARRCS